MPDGFGRLPLQPRPHANVRQAVVAADHSRIEYAQAEAIQAPGEIDAAGTVVTFDIVDRPAS
ncbi:hypothetical protein [Streptomyces wuyuanensis]|uniref:hypothetical protein n=1 Tax=Streptomyces wuyuanensis TaxID=1196353 RepID=UPI003444268D